VAAPAWLTLYATSATTTAATRTASEKYGDYIAYVRNPANGFLSMPLPLKGSTELSVRR
jgi:hypothetical protein